MPRRSEAAERQRLQRRPSIPAPPTGATALRRRASTRPATRARFAAPPTDRLATLPTTAMACRRLCADDKRPSTFTCRSAAGECDVEEHCDGSTDACPADARKPSNTACTDDGSICSLDRCDGTSAACQHPAGNSGTIVPGGAGSVRLGRNVQRQRHGLSGGCQTSDHGHLPRRGRRLRSRRNLRRLDRRLSGGRQESRRRKLHQRRQSLHRRPVQRKLELLRIHTGKHRRHVSSLGGAMRPGRGMQRKLGGVSQRCQASQHFRLPRSCRSVRSRGALHRHRRRLSQRCFQALELRVPRRELRFGCSHARHQLQRERGALPQRDDPELPGLAVRRQRLRGRVHDRRAMPDDAVLRGRRVRAQDRHRAAVRRIQPLRERQLRRRRVLQHAVQCRRMRFVRADRVR